ncbi:Zinc finger-domain containing protein, partial [Trema orientale]
FRCRECDFDMDVQCALMANSAKTRREGQQDCIQHSTHPHLLFLVDTDAYKDTEIKCFACESNSSASGGGVYYGCTRCEYFLHKSCIDQLPQDVLHPLHSHHGLLSLRARSVPYRCRICERRDEGTFYFECPRCDFKLCVQCYANKVRGIVNYEDHEHPLCFVEKMYTRIDQCNAYDSNCKLSADISNSNEFGLSMFRCVDCDFKLHLLCGPLPNTIKHGCHIHPLLLFDSFIEDNSGEYYCDVCEAERDPRIRMYYCDQCKFLSHVHCVISEIVNVLKGDLSDVKLKTVGEDVWKLPREIVGEENEQGRPRLTLKDLIDKLPEDDIRKLRSHFYWDEHYKREQVELGDEYIDEILRISSFTESQFIYFFGDESFSRYSRKKLKINSSDLTLKIVDVQGYSIPFTLVYVFKHLLHKYGDISWPSYCSPEMKSVTFFFICQVMKKIHTTLVIDITKDLLHDWYCYYYFARVSLNFDMNFLRALLKEATTAFFYLEVSRLLDENVPTILEKKITEYKTKLEQCNKFRESTSKKGSMNEGLNRLMKLKWKT